MLLKLARLCALAAALFCARPAVAGDLYSFYDSACGRVSGILVHADEERVVLVDLSGHAVAVYRNKVHAVVLHQLLENPIEEIVVDTHLKQYLRDVWIGGDAQPSFTGWATGFFDDLLIFVDLNGKTHVLDPGDISKLSPSKHPESAIRPPVYAAPTLAFPPEIVPCSRVAPPPGALPPSRVVADRIKLGDYFTKLEEHYLELEGFEERTRVYAKPFLFDEASRVGLLYDQADPLPFPFPFYFRWSSGRPYRFQSETIIGNSAHAYLPLTTPTLSASSDAKSHFFNAIFIGNIVALPAGTDAFVLDDIDMLVGGTQRPTSVDISYNYMILMGVDYWRLSLSAGPAYLATRVTIPDTGSGTNIGPRDVRAEEMSPTVLLRYHAPHFRARGLYFHTSMDGEDEVGEGLTDFRLRAQAARFGITFDLLEEVELSVDQIVRRGTYRESFLSPIGDASGSVSYMHLETLGTAGLDFGRYVTVRGFARILHRRNDLEINVDFQLPPNYPNGKSSRTETTFGGSLEFVF